MTTHARALPDDWDCAHAVDTAVKLLAALRGLTHDDDAAGPAVHLHLLGALHRRVLRELLHAALDAYEEGDTPDDITSLAGLD